MSPQCNCWFISLLVFIAVAPFGIAVVTLLQKGDALLAAALLVVFLVWVIVILMRLLHKQAQDQEHQDNQAEQGLSSSLAAAESPPAYDVVIKSPPPYFSFPGQGSDVQSPPTMYYCYCGSSNASNASSSCMSCNTQSHGPYIIHLKQDACHLHENQSCSDPFLPSYSAAMNMKECNNGRDEMTHL